METNWLELWRELIDANRHTHDSEPIAKYVNHARQTQQRPDPLLDSVLKSIDEAVTVLDIGAGNGRWTIPLARTAKMVTAVEPADDMLELLRENTKTAQVNVQVIQSCWEEAVVDTHDVVVCAHGMYSSADFTRFVRKMEQYARKTCYMAIRLPPADGIIGELSNAIYGCVHDSANAVIAYNALYSLGICPNVLVQNDMHHWTSDNLEEAFIRAKRHLHLESTREYDGQIRDTLKKRLLLSNNCYYWPDGMRSALLWWSPSTVANAARP